MSTYAPPSRRPAPAKLRTAQVPPRSHHRASSEPGGPTFGSIRERLPTPLAKIQFKLRIGDAHDPLEREADQIAEQIVSESDGTSHPMAPVVQTELVLGAPNDPLEREANVNRPLETVANDPDVAHSEDAGSVR